MPRPRIQTLSDMIFGLALSISAFSLIGQKASTTGEFVTSLGIYALSFFIVVNVWRSYSRTTSILPLETQLLTSLNIILLFLVSIEPYIFAELFTGIGSFPSNVSEVYALDIGFMFLILAAFNHVLSSEERNLVPRSFLDRYKWWRNASLLVAVIFFISSIPYFDSVIMFTYVISGNLSDFTLRTTFWVVGLVVGWSTRFLARGSKSNSKLLGPTPYIEVLRGPAGLVKATLLRDSITTRAPNC
jgi:uncharacterized membrane protein